MSVELAIHWWQYDQWQKVNFKNVNWFFVNIGPTLAKKIPVIYKSPPAYVQSSIIESIIIVPVDRIEINKMYLLWKIELRGGMKKMQSSKNHR